MAKDKRASTKQLRLKELRDFYRLGQKAKKKTWTPGDDSPPVGYEPERRNRRNMGEFVEEQRRPWTYCDRAEKFANLYTPKQFQKFYRANDQAELPLSVTHVYQLLLVKDHKLREKLTSEALEGGWTTRVLKRVMEERTGAVQRYAHSGRQTTIPFTADDARGKLRSEATRLHKCITMLQTLQSTTNPLRLKVTSPLSKSMKKCEKSVQDLLEVLQARGKKKTSQRTR